MTCSRANRAGIGLVEVVVVVVLAVVVLLGMLMVLPRQRETARRMACRRNLSHLGKALALYDQSQGHVPGVPVLGGSAPAPTAATPLAALLGTLGVVDFDVLDDPQAASQAMMAAGGTPVPRRIVGLLCPDDRVGWDSPARAPVSYRAVAGDGPEGGTGVFAPGRVRTLAEVEAADGQAYTAAFTERLIGPGRDGQPGLSSYQLVPGPVEAAACPTAPASSHRGDAGSDWSVAGWVWTLANQTLTPNESPSCVARDGVTARMGASSSHASCVHVLFCDGAVSSVSPRIDAKVWKAMANLDDRREVPAP